MNNLYRWPAGYSGPVHTTMDLTEYTHNVLIMKEDTVEHLSVIIYYETLDFTMPTNYKSSICTSQLNYNFKYIENVD